MSEINAITVPKFGMNMQEGKVVGWLSKPGDSISEGDEIVDIESEKIVNALEATASGVLRRIVVEESDEMYPVGKLLGVIADDTVSDADIDAFIAEKEAGFAEEMERRGNEDSGPASVEVNGRIIEYSSAGEGEPTTVFVHGIGGQKEAWVLTQGAVSETGRAVAIDLPGHGGSSKTVDSGELDELATCILGVMDELEIDAAHFVGHSLGGVIAAHIAKTQPRRAKSVFLISSAGPGTVVDPQFIEDFGNAESRKEVKNALTPLFVDKKMVSKDMVQAVLKIKRIDGANDCLKMIGDVSGTALATLNPADTISTIDVPISIVWGAEDAVCSLDNTKGLPASVSLTVIEGAGHMVQLEAMDKVNELILEHIRAS